MRKIEGTKLDALPIPDLEHVRDLDYFDGPLLSQYAHPNGDVYLHYWCDCDDSVNRWMVLRVSEASVLRLVNGFVPLIMVIPQACRDDFVYFLETNNDQSVASVVLARLDAIPEEYKPEEDAYLESIVTRGDENSYSVLVEGGWSVKELGDFPRTFAGVYSLLYGLNVLHIREFESYPWRGGFSSMHFFDSAARRIPAEHRPRVAAMQYASPGFMRFELHGRTADQVTRCVSDYTGKNEELAANYADLKKYIRDHGLNEIDSSSDQEWEKHNEPLTQKAQALIDGFDVINGTAFVSACERPFEAAKLATAFYRRVRKLTTFEKDGRVRFPRAPADPNSS